MWLGNEQKKYSFNHHEEEKLFAKERLLENIQ